MIIDINLHINVNNAITLNHSRRDNLALPTYFHMPPKPSQSSRTWFNLRKPSRHNMIEHASSHEGKYSQRTPRRLSHISIDLHSLSLPLSSRSVLLRHVPVPKQGTKHLVTDVLVLPYQLLLRPATIDATLQLAQLKGTHPRLSHCLQE